MAFNSAKFAKQEFEPRTEKLEVPVLAEWFDKDEKPEWIVRGLTGSEFVKAQSAQEKHKLITSLAEALVAGNNNDKVSALKEMLGNSDDVPAELAKRIEMFVFGTVKPEIDMSIAVKLAKSFPSDFMIITNKIINLTAMGANMVKRKPSGKTPT